MVYVKLNNEEELNVPSDIISNIYPEEFLNTQDILLLPMVDPKTFKLFVKDYKNIENVPFHDVISYVNIATSLQLDDILTKLEDKIVDCLQDEKCVKMLKPYKNQFLDDLSQMLEGPSYEILRRLSYFNSLYKIDSPVIIFQDTSLNLDYVVANQEGFYFSKRDGHDVRVFENGRFKYREITGSKEAGENYEPVIFNNGELRLIKDGSLIEWSKDGNRYSKYVHKYGNFRDDNLLIYDKYNNLLLDINSEIDLSSSTFNYGIAQDYIDDSFDIKTGYQKKHGNESLDGDIYIYNLNDLSRVKINDLDQSISMDNTDVVWSPNEKYVMLDFYTEDNTFNMYIVRVSDGHIISNLEIGDEMDLFILGDTGIFYSYDRKTYFIPFIKNGQFIDLDMKNSILIHTSKYDSVSILRSGLDDGILIANDIEIVAYRKSSAQTLTEAVSEILS